MGIIAPFQVDTSSGYVVISSAPLRGAPKEGAKLQYSPGVKCRDCPEHKGVFIVIPSHASESVFNLPISKHLRMEHGEKHSAAQWWRQTQSSTPFMFSQTGI